MGCFLAGLAIGLGVGLFLGFYSKLIKFFKDLFKMIRK